MDEWSKDWMNEVMIGWMKWWLDGWSNDWMDEVMIKWMN